MNNSQNQTKAFQFALTAVLLWSTVATAFKLALQELSILQLLSLASGSSLMVLSVLIVAQNKHKQAWSVLKRKWFVYLFFSLLNPVGYYLVLFNAYDRLPASQAQPLNYTWAIALTFMSAIFLGQKIRVKDWLASGLGYFGVLIIATQGQPFSLQFNDLTGVSLALFSTFLWASYWILNTKVKSDPVISVLLCFLFGTLWLVPYTAMTEGYSDISLMGWSSAAYIGIFEMGITFVFWLSAMKYATNTALISNLIFISPFISLVLLSIFIGEVIYVSTITGLCLIVFGLLIQNVNIKALRSGNKR